MRILRKAILLSFALSVFFGLGAVLSQRAEGTGFSMKRNSLSQLPTGCQQGKGPQFRSFDGRLGLWTEENSRWFVDFFPAATCKEAAKVCTSQLAGQSCCKEACRQREEQKNGQFDRRRYSECADRCIGLPSFKTLKPSREGSSMVRVRDQRTPTE